VDFEPDPKARKQTKMQLVCQKHYIFVHFPQDLSGDRTPPGPAETPAGADAPEQNPGGCGRA
jgi:hypothetical protein